MTLAKLIFDCPDRNADLYYATKFLAPDDVLYLEHGGKKYFILSDLEFERGRKGAKVDKVFSLAELTRRAKAKQETGSVGVIATLLRERKIRKVTVPRTTPFTLVDGLRKKGFEVEPGENPFYPERHFKTPQEKKWMHHCQRVTFKAIALAEKILRASSARRGLLYWKGKILTSERMREALDHFLLTQGFHSTYDIIAAGGAQACGPHNIGSGPLRPHQAIIVDVFPRSDETRFYGDATRTFCKGRASPELKRQYAAVKAAQEMAIRKIRAGVNAKTIWQAVHRHFESNGFPTKEIAGSRQGFIHGVGHGIGLDIHEEPVRISSVDFTLLPRHVVTVEPGLYYLKTGGVRLEDIVSVTRNGCELFPTYPKRLEIL